MASLKRYNFEGASKAADKKKIGGAHPGPAPELAHTRQESSETVTSAGVATPLESPPSEAVPRFGGGAGGGGGGGAPPKGRTWDSSRDVDQFRTETVSVLQRFMRDAQEQQQMQQQQQQQ